MKHSGVSKESLCGLINGRMIDAGITHRKNDNIREKIKSLEASFKRAEDWRANTGQGVTDEGDLKSALAKLCPYYDQLAPVMLERASTRPLYSSDALHDRGNIDSDSESESDVENQPSSIGISVAKYGSKKRKSVEEEWNDIRSSMLKVKQEEDAKRMKIEEQKLALAVKKEDRESKLGEVNLVIMQAKAREAVMHEKTQLLLARRQLQDAGVNQDEIDKMLPI
ncbi:hypothetical protein L917_21555 [Phytophthora nicotianae]|uniref:Glucose-6-phosphate 1-epimerase n=2 Tax=Phytophthora nicotianae TaxID=4792 RepID=A0A0W8D9E7_PHYNI|nr:hypothetical protein L917_21555 [Phytophthora nicotianae]KUF81176.1 hypothetical protein AM587_10002456 [Phytophthora nicotianae]KUF93015.1 Glucose-6-phosphate 1-epimerase [Phytophthora nicotianae]